MEEFDLEQLIGDVNTVQEVQSLTKKLLNDNPKLNGEEYESLRYRILKLFKNENIAFN